ncbi:TonB-linked SusC/RagA family outer membrane protein [Chitinophaga niastensis]|uniref:TonB-linked SusC/RagA family outer membrane protein n=1 Tax=Chitinophaga niastensis TaxID=536980 RepID=A0A2P8HH83_CHINA|nr:SusC/RagA family TonB-linked outer membrane protein [Chitinophaga niastensis]PSL45588.1 TonB-linked SusC/RagA family outer membrane protein [Chitinophaga niastensis]
MKLFHLKLRAILCTALAVLTGLNVAFAQSEIRGAVTDANNQSIIGASVLIKGTKKGTTTDAQGHFVINASANATLTFSFIGFDAKEVPVNNRTNITVVLQSKDEGLNEVVVTALGIKKEKKAVGYAVQEVKGAELVKAREPNVINSLTGKVAGLRIATSTDLFGDPGISLRGKSTIIVVDGVRINSNSWNLSADDIESFSVLKGPSAAALYGSDGINGAIQITTKRGSKNKRGYSVEFNSSTQVQTGFNAKPGLQSEYGPGSDFQYEFVDGSGGGTNDADYDVWGPRFEGQMINQWDSKIDPNTGKLMPLPWTAKGKNNLTNFLQKGLLSSNNLAVSANNDKGDIRFSMTQLYQKGMVPNTKLNATNINFSGGLNITKKLRLESNINYNKQYTPNIPSFGYQPSSPIYAMMVWGAANYDVRDLRDYWQPGKVGTQQKNVEYYQYSNPYFIAYEELQGYYKDDIYGYVKLKYNIADNFDIHLRSNVSTNYVNTQNRYPISTSQYNGDGGYFQKGGYNESYNYFWENNTDVLATYTKDLTSNFSFKGSAGANLLSRRTNYQYSHTNNGLLVPQLWTVQNSVDPSSTETDKATYQRKSAYALADFDYKRMLFLSLTGRVDQASTLPQSKGAYFYPSVSLSALISEMVKLPSFVSYAKLRASYAKVGNDGLPASPGYSSYYKLAPTYSTGVRWNGNPSLYYDGTLYDPGISPEFNKSLEFGGDFRFLKNRLGIDLTYFRNIEGPSIFYLPLSATSGATSLQRNGLTYNRKGVELILTGSPVRSKNFSWDVTINWSTQQRYLKGVYDTLNAYNRVKVGERTDKLFLTDFQRTPDGQVVYSATSGRPLKNSYTTFQGYTNERWMGSLQNTFRYRNLSLSFMFDGRYGGKLVNYVSQKQWQAGAAPGSANEYRLDDWNNRNTANYKGTYVGQGVNITGGSLVVDGNGNVIADSRKFQANTTTVKWESFAKGYWGSEVPNLVDKSYMKLREVTISYTVPQSLLSGQKLFNAASLTLVGRNLWYLTKDKNARNIDLDQWTSGSTNLETPSVKSFGVNINLTF